MRIRDAVVADLPAIVEIYNSAIPSRVVAADTEPVSVEQRLGWFEEHGRSRRPIWVVEREGEVIGWLSLGAFLDRRPAYHATAAIGVYIREDRRGEGMGRLVEEAILCGPELGLRTLTAGAFAHNETSVRLFGRMGFRKRAHFPHVAELDGVERDLVVLGLRLDEREG